MIQCGVKSMDAPSPPAQKGRWGSVEGLKQSSDIFTLLITVACGRRGATLAALVRTPVVSNRAVISSQKVKDFVPYICIEASTMDEEEWFARTGLSVIQTYSVDIYGCHAFPSGCNE